MTQEEINESTIKLEFDKDLKKLFDADVCARIPYGLHCCVYDFGREVRIEDDILYEYDHGGNCRTLKLTVEHPKEALMYYQIRPYLRPMSSMTEEEREELSNYENSVQRTDFFYAHHIDCRFLIEKGLALEAPEGMYKV